MCLPLTSPGNGTVTLSGRSVGDIATYTCSDVFYLMGNMTTVCQSNGSWSDVPPMCISKQIYMLQTLLLEQGNIPVFCIHTILYIISFQ